VKKLLLLALIVAVPVAGIAQTPITEPVTAPVIAPAAEPVIVPAAAAVAAPAETTIAAPLQTAIPLDWQGKLQFHATAAYGPLSLLGIGAYAGFLQETNSPREWGQGAAAYGKRLGSTLAWSGIHGTLAFGLDSALHEDPRYYRSTGTGFWRRSGHALRGTLLTRTDAGGETVSVWRIGSAYGAAFLSNTWYPPRLDNPRYGLEDGSVTLGFGFVSNLALEFWPDVKAKFFHQKVGP
jgi:hypothetical protein